MKALVLTTCLAFSPAFAYDTADFEAETNLGESDAALAEAEEAKKRLEEAKKERAEQKAKAKETAREARALEKQALTVTLSVEEQIKAVHEQTALYRSEIVRLDAEKKKSQREIAVARAKLDRAKKKRDDVMKQLQTKKAGK